MHLSNERFFLYISSKKIQLAFCDGLTQHDAVIILFHSHQSFPRTSWLFTFPELLPFPSTPWLSSFPSHTTVFLPPAPLVILPPAPPDCIPSPCTSGHLTPCTPWLYSFPLHLWSSYPLHPLIVFIPPAPLVILPPAPPDCIPSSCTSGHLTPCTPWLYSFPLHLWSSYHLHPLIVFLPPAPLVILPPAPPDCIPSPCTSGHLTPCTPWLYSFPLHLWSSYPLHPLIVLLTPSSVSVQLELFLCPRRWPYRGQCEREWTQAASCKRSAAGQWRDSRDKCHMSDNSPVIIKNITTWHICVLQWRQLVRFMCNSYRFFYKLNGLTKQSLYL